MRGADALNTCMNAVAILFVLEIDNLAFDMGVDDETKAQFVAAHQIRVSNADSALLRKSKAIYFRVAFVGILLCMLGYRLALNDFFSWFLLLYFFSLCASVLEALTGGSPSRSRMILSS